MYGSVFGVSLAIIYGSVFECSLAIICVSAIRTILAITDLFFLHLLDHARLDGCVGSGNYSNLKGDIDSIPASHLPLLTLPSLLM